MLAALALAAYVNVPAGELVGVLARERAPQPVAAFAMRETPVTQAEFRRFLQAHPAWQPARVPRTFASAAYLAGGDAAAAASPVVQVSWFAAQAFCATEGGRLPTWAEWEYVAAADDTRADAREDPAWRARILAWYAQPAGSALPAVGGAPNLYGLRDLHGLVWEWVDDFNALLVAADSRGADDPDKLKFCGAGAIDVQDKRHYAVLMRIALLSSLTARDGTGTLGFRCVKEIR